MKKLSHIIKNLKQEVRQARGRLETSQSEDTREKAKHTIKHSGILVLKLESAKREIESQLEGES